MTQSWRDNAKVVLQEWHEARRPPSESNLAELDAALNSFGVAVVQWAVSDQDPKPLVAWLRSDKPISRHGRALLADAIESSTLVWRKKQGRPRKRDVQGAATAAKWAYSRWLRLNRECGVNDYGHRSEMMDEAIRMAIEVEERNGVDPEDVRELLERPTSRRK